MIMEAVSASEVLVDFNQTIKHHIPEHGGWWLVGWFIPVAPIWSIGHP
jgi:hypothetical protein